MNKSDQSKHVISRRHLCCIDCVRSFLYCLLSIAVIMLYLTYHFYAYRVQPS